jgi:L-threonylcarbamoyladenylate synthase
MLDIGDKNTLDEVVATLEAGGVALFPTDTAYALCADATNREAVLKIHKIKERETSKKLPVFFDTVERVKQEAILSERAQKLAERFWPGALTLISPVIDAGEWSSGVIENNMIGIRIPDSKFIRDVIRKLGKPITSTSANRSGKESCYSVEEVQKSLGPNFDMIDVVVDGGVLAQKPVSTIVKVVCEDVEIIREKAISREEIKEVVK